MRKIKLTIEYDGTNYCGWQSQENGPSVQSALKRTFDFITGEDAIIFGASRTDAGVHARAQVAHLITNTKIPNQGLKSKLNSRLPSDIVVSELLEVDCGFDAMRDAGEKTYLYRILNRREPSALSRNRAWHMDRPLDLDAMRAAARVMVGRKDFSSFRATRSSAKTSVREVVSIDLERDGDFVEIEVRGMGFLRHMVRIMVGTLVDAGVGRLSPKDVAEIIEARDRASASVTAPPQGLYLTRIEY